MKAKKNYQQKRKFSITPEPGWKISKHKSRKLKFVIQKHDASHLHYDLRLEINGVLKSWAVPKGPSLDPTVKRLAVEVEDHPLSYATFEGVIPKGQYGGGEVIVWDNGTWETIDDDPIKSLKKGHLKFKLHGKKLNGEWLLIRTSRDSNKPQWLLRKLDDVAANDEVDITALHPESVKTGKLLKRDAVNQPRFKKIIIKAIHWREPQLATLVDKIPSGSNWLYEIKYDGYRILAEIKAGKVTLLTRRHNDWTEKFKSIAQALKDINVDYALLDGEVVVLNNDGISDFQALQNALNQHNTTQLTYFVFDILQLNNENLTQLPLIERKERLKKLLNNSTLNKQILFSDHFQGEQQGKSFFKKACEIHLEGVMAKRLDSPYHFGRNDNWLKVKCIERQEFVIAGFTAPSGSREAFGALLLGYYDKEKKLHYAGKVGTGFNSKDLKDLHKIFKKYIQSKSAFSEPPKEAHVTWLKPTLVAEIQFSEWTSDKRLRAPSFIALREDKAASDITREKPKELKNISSTVKNPQKIFFPNIHLTKQQLADYYEKIADYIMPHLQNRPLYVLRCPEGIEHQCFHQKHLTQKSILGIKKIIVKKTKNKEESFIVENKKGLISLIQLGTVEFHIWNENEKHIGFPDQLTFDLDPDPNIKWKDMIKTAFLLKDVLDDLGLKSFVKTTGGKGLHITVPIKAIYSWQLIYDFSKAIADTLVKMNPKLYIATSSKQKRKNKIFIDYMRNHQGATIIAPYSTRARPSAPIATPISWDELKKNIKSDSININNIFKILAKRKKDPWQDFFVLKQTLSKDILKIVKK